ncbi:MAG: hypothetical protein M3506_10170 [Chloroflexota bacterium]|nr:hypothetical protein [Chloroflexota bacterium]
MTETLRRVVSEIERLPPHEQDAIARELQLRLDEREWDALVRSPESQQLLEHLAAEARSEDDQHETRDLTTSL